MVLSFWYEDFDHKGKVRISTCNIFLCFTHTVHIFQKHLGMEHQYVCVEHQYYAIEIPKICLKCKRQTCLKNTIPKVQKMLKKLFFNRILRIILKNNNFQHLFFKNGQNCVSLK